MQGVSEAEEASINPDGDCKLNHSVSAPALSRSFSILTDRRPKTVEAIYEARELDKEIADWVEGKKSLQKSKSSVDYFRNRDTKAAQKKKSASENHAAWQHDSFSFKGVSFGAGPEPSLNLSGRKLVLQDLLELQMLLVEESSPAPTELVLSDNQLCGRETEAGPFDPKGLANLFRCTASASLVRLDLSRVLLGAHGARMLGDIFSGDLMPGLKTLTLDGNFLGGFWNGPDIFEHTSEALTVLLQNLPHGLTDLSMNNNRIGHTKGTKKGATSSKLLPPPIAAARRGEAVESIDWVHALASGRLSNLRLLSLSNNALGGRLDEDGEFVPMQLAAVDLFTALGEPILAIGQAIGHHSACKGPLRQQLEAIDLSCNTLGTAMHPSLHHLGTAMLGDAQGAHTGDDDAVRDDAVRDDVPPPHARKGNTKKLATVSGQTEGGRCAYCVQHKLHPPEEAKSMKVPYSYCLLILA
jgi:hypothetical protein